MFATPAFATILSVPQGGTGTSSLSGIVQGNGTSAFNAVTIGTGLSYTGGTLSATGTGTIGGSIATGQIPVGTAANTIGGTSNLTFISSILHLNGNMQFEYFASGRRIKTADASGTDSGVDFSILGSDGTTATNGGNLVFKAGTSASGTDGRIIWVDPSSAAQAVFSLDNLTGSRIYTFPDASGALLNGSLSSTQLAYGGATANTISGSANMTFDSTNVLLALTHGGLATTPSTATILQNLTTASLAVPQQISPALEFKGTMWQSGGGGIPHVGTFRMYQIPTNGGTAGSVTAGKLQIDSSKDGSYTTNIFNLSSAGTLTLPIGGLIVQSSITSTTGSITAASQVSAGSDLLSGTNGTTAGHLYLYGGTTGNLNITAPANVTNYGVTLPAAQGAANQTYLNNGAGVLSWGTIPTLPAAPVDLTAQTAAITATTVCTPATTGMYRIPIYLQVTTPGSVSSILGGASGVVLTYNDGDGNVAQTDTVGLTAPNGTVVTTLNTNTTTTNLSGALEVYAQAGVSIQFAIGYTSVGTAMQYSAHLRCEAI